MTSPDLFINNANRLRSGWRFLIFLIALFFVFQFLGTAVNLAKQLISPATRTAIGSLIGSGYGFIIQGALLLTAATLLGWLCGRFLEDLPLRAFGWTPHRGWWRDLLIGTFIGSATLLFAAGLIAVSGGYRFAFNADASLSSIFFTLLFSMIVFIIGAAGEEALFRGYPLQTLLRSHTILIAALPASLLFATGHLDNPNVALFWTFLNTTLAGIWLAIAYWRTRSLWFPLGVHWSWNWTMASVLGTPVSGITSIASQPLLRATETGADWFTGGTYGVEGGAACTIILIISTIFIWRTRLLNATEVMRAYTDAEQPSASLRIVTAVDELI